MATICYPYGSGITCVCDGPNIYKCFPDLKTSSGDHGSGGSKNTDGVVLGANTLMDNTDQSIMDHWSAGLDRR